MSAIKRAKTTTLAAIAFFAVLSTTHTLAQLPDPGMVIDPERTANLCTESHMRELIEQGFEVAVVSDATAAAQVPDGDGYASAVTNFRFIANTVWTTDEAVKQIRDGGLSFAH